MDAHRPQAYFSRHALRMAARLAPVLKLYQVGLYPVAKPTAMFLNWWLGLEGIRFLHERDFRALITQSKTNGPCCRSLSARPPTRSCGN
jgi:CBS domain containing-hemolysin-like protein